MGPFPHPGPLLRVFENIPIDVELMLPRLDALGTTTLGPEFFAPAACPGREPGVPLCTACPIAFQLTRNFGQNMRMVRTHRTTKHNRPERYKLVYQRGTDDGPPIGRQLDRRLCERGRLRWALWRYRPAVGGRL